MNFKRCARQMRRCLLPMLGLLLGSGPLWAAQVTSATDSNSAGSLRSAVAAGGAVTFAPGLSGQTIVLTLGQIAVPNGTTITGLGATSLGVDGNQASRIFDIAAGATATISGLRLVNGNAGAGGQGGAIRNLGTLILDGVAISTNSAGDAGGGIYNAGTLDVRASTLNGNRVTDSGCAGGGAIRSEGSGSQLTITNSTLSANTATTCSGGGVSFNNGVATITASTLSANSAGASGGNLYKGSAAASLTLSASVISDGASGGGTPVNSDLHGAIGGGLVSSGYNLVRVRGDGIGYVVSDLAAGTAPLLSALANYGGPTATLALQPTSPLIDARVLPCPTSTDQRGFARPQGAACDIGAFERRSNRLTTTVAGLGSVSAGATPAPTAGGISNCSGTCTADYDGEVEPSITLTATPGAGQLFVGWDGACVGSLASINFPMDHPRNCTATFAPATAVVTASAGLNGTISPNGAQTVNIGSVVVFTLTPSPNYHVANVTGTCGGSRSGNTYTTAPITAACTVNATFAIDTFTVTPSAGPHGAISPNTPQTADYNSALVFTLAPDAGYHVDTVTGCGGTRTGNTYTTGAITAACAVNATFAIDTFTVTPSAGVHGAISPSTPQTVDYNAVLVFTVTPDANYHVASVSGCGGTLAGTTYTTAPITGVCAVNATFAIDTHTVTPSVNGGNGTISPSTAQTVNHGATTSFTLAPSPNYHVASVTGTCGGSLVGSTYTTSAVNGDCTVIASFTIDTHTATPSVNGGNGTISPSTAQTVNHGATTSFTLTPSTNYHVASVTGTCGGSLAGTTYTTSAVTADCTVIASFTIDTHAVTPSVNGGNGTISPSTVQTVNHGATTNFTLTPSTNYHVASVTGTCGGSLAGSTYTTSAVNGDCTVIASFTIDTHTVTPSVSGSNGTISPSTVQTINHGATTSFTLAPSPNYHVASVTGTCGGSLAGTTYTTSMVTADCTVIASFTIDTHAVTPSVNGSNGTISPSTPQTVNHGATTSFTLAPSPNYHVASVTGTCGGSLAGTTYTTSAVTADCTVIASFAIDTHAVTPSVNGSNGTISPSTVQTVNHGATTSFTLAPSPNYHVANVAGTCGGSLAGTTYTTSAVTADCTVIASFAIDTHTVTPSVSGSNGTISPSTAQTVNHGATTSFTLAPSPNYHVANVTGTCGGNLAGTTYTTSAVMADCTVIASFAIDTHAVTPSVNGSNGTISPSTAQTVNHGATTSFTLTPSTNYHVASVTGTCGGSLAGSTYTTSAVNADCTVIASFTIDTHAVTPSVSGSNGTISPSTAQTVNHGATTSFTLTPNTNYHVASVTGTCGGNLAGTTYTTSAVTADCTVIASFTIDTHAVTPSVNGSNGTISPSTVQTVNHGATTSFTLTPSTNYHVASVTGTCGGNLAGTTYTTSAVTADCTVIASFAIDTFTVTLHVGEHGAISPNTPQTANYNDTVAFTLTPDTGYHIDTVNGCGGTLAGNVYTTAPVTAACTVDATFAIDTFTVTPSAGAHGAISPNTPQTANYNDTVAFTLTPDPGYHIDSVNGCGGVLAGNVYTTAPVTAACSVDAHFVVSTYTIGGSVSGLQGGQLVLQLNGAQDLPIDANGAFVFAAPLNDLGAYAVTVSQQPTAPAHLCTVSNGAGTLAGADVTDVVVTCERLQPMLDVSVSDGRAYARYGMLLDYVVTVTNSGQGDANDVTLANTLPPQVDADYTHWICLGGGAGTACTANGTGALNDSQVAIPAGRSLTWLVTAPVRTDAQGGTLDNTVGVSGANPVSTTDSDILVLLRSGFDVPYDDGAQGSGDTVACTLPVPLVGGSPVARAGEIDLTATSMLTLPSASSPAPIDTILRAQDATSAGFRVERLNFGTVQRVRLVSRNRDGREQASEWATTTAGAQLALATVDTDAGRQLLLEGVTPSLDLVLPAGIADRLRVLAPPMGQGCGQ